MHVIYPLEITALRKFFAKMLWNMLEKKPQRTNLAPYKALKELARVASKTIEVYVPHRFSLFNCEKKFWIRRHNAFLT